MSSQKNSLKNTQTGGNVKLMIQTEYKIRERKEFAVSEEKATADVD